MSRINYSSSVIWIPHKNFTCSLDKLKTGFTSPWLSDITFFACWFTFMFLIIKEIDDITWWVRRLYEFYFQVAKEYFTHSLHSFVKYCFCHKKIKFISSSSRVMFFLLYRQKELDKIIEGNYWNYAINKLTCDIMENIPLWSRM